jgi:hypothetical protein
MAGKGIEFFDGAMSVDAGVSTASPSEPSMKSGGPMDMDSSGIDAGHSFTVPTNPTNTVSGMGQGKGSPISGPCDE